MPAKDSFTLFKAPWMATLSLITLFASLPAELRAGDQEPQAQQPQAQEPQAQQSVAPVKRPASSIKAPSPLTTGEKLRLYATSTYGPTSLLRSGLGAAYGQARDKEPEWGQGLEGYGKRYASRFGQHVVKRTIMFGVGSMLHEDPRYYYSEKTGFLPRLNHAVTHTFITRKDDGSEAPAYGRFAGAFGGGLISRTWHPESSDSLTDGLRSGAVSIGIDVGFRAFHEFWPDVRRVVLHR